MKETLKNNKGITLVALILTIIILIILAGISISVLTGQDGIINKAKDARQNMELATIEEQEQLNTLYDRLATGTGYATSYDIIADIGKGTAKQEHVLKPYTAYIDGQLKEGTMIDREELNWNPSESTSLTIEPGYYSGGTISTENAYNAGYDDGYNTFDETRLKVLETGTFSTGNVKAGTNEITVNTKNNYIRSQKAKLTITGFTITSGSVGIYMQYEKDTGRRVVGNSTSFYIYNPSGQTGSATVDYIIIGYPTE